MTIYITRSKKLDYEPKQCDKCKELTYADVLVGPEIAVFVWGCSCGKWSKTVKHDDSGGCCLFLFALMAAVGIGYLILAIL